MKVPKNSYACNICQKPFNNLNILGKHVEFRHASAEQSPKSKIGSVPKAKDLIITNNLDPLEISKDNSVTIRIIEFVPVQEYVEKVQSKVTTEEINNLHDNSSMLRITKNVFEQELLPLEKQNNGDTTKTASSAKNDVVVTPKKTVSNQNSSAIMNGGISKSQMNFETPEAFVGSELNKVGYNHNSSLENNATIKISNPEKNAKKLESTMLKIIERNCDSSRQFMPDGQFQNRIRVRTCSVKIQKLPNKFDILAKRMSIVSVHEENKPFKCKVCGKTFSTNQHVNEHYESVHEGKKRFKCNDCDKAFSQKQSLNGHMKTVHEEKFFDCNVFGKVFSQKQSLNEHIESVHEVKQPFKCNDCSKAFSQKHTLNRHIESVHEGKKNFNCSICNAAFSRKENLNEHIRSVHGKKPKI